MTLRRRAASGIVGLALVACGHGRPAQPDKQAQAAIRKVVQSNVQALQGCYGPGLARDRTLRGTVTVRFVIDRDGRVKAADDAGSDLKDAAVVSCVASVVKGMKFTPPEGGRTVTVVYPFVLRPGA